jgi:pyridoxal phosphate enzyme (YggS family)
MSERSDLIASALRDVHARIERSALKASRSPNDVTLISVTKTYPFSDVQILFDLGERNFGENRTEEGSEKSKEVSAIWHFQGQVQSRKLREIALWADFIHSLDKSDHIMKLARHCEELQKQISVFIQLSLDGNPERGGVLEDELLPLAEIVNQSSHLKLAGLMCVPPVEYELERAFSEIAKSHLYFKTAYPEAEYLSAGMSGDYEVAVQFGATHLRVGSQILGSRNYHP